MQLLLSSEQLKLSIKRLSHQLIESYHSLNDVVFIGIQPRGIRVSELIVEEIQRICPNENIQYGILDILFTEMISAKSFMLPAKQECRFLSKIKWWC